MEPTVNEKYQTLRLLYSRRKFIVALSLICGVAAVIFSSPFFLTPLFRSETILYPPATNSSKSLIERDARFGSDKEIDEQIQLLRSTVVRDSVIRKFELYSQYEVDTNRSDKRYQLYELYDSNIKIERTRYNSISVSVLDANPELAARMANYIVATGDQLRSVVIKSKLREAVNALNKSLFELSVSIDASASAINQKFGRKVVSGTEYSRRDYLEQLKEQLDLKEVMQSARNTNNTSRLEELYLYESKLQQLAAIRSTYDQAVAGLNNQVPSSFVISPAEIADKKAFPIRWLIVLAALAGSFFAACIIVVISENLREFRQNLK